MSIVRTCKSRAYRSIAYSTAVSYERITPVRTGIEVRALACLTQANKSDQIVAGILAIFVLAVIIDVALMFAGRIATPWVRVTRPGRRLLTAPVEGGSR